jgi:tetratricopeptide (TPR) repeat protein
MCKISRIFLVALFVAVAMAQSPEPPLSDTRLTVHTLVREDVFAGFLTDDMERFARGEKNIQTLLEKRPAEKSSLLAWKAGVATYRAVRAHEANRSDEFQREYRQALDLFSQARELGSNDPGVAAVTGGVYAVFADRLPKEHREAAWSTAYDSYQALWKAQGPVVDQLPVHLRGELLGGLAASALRTGRTEEAMRHLDKILAALAGTPYEPVAKKWKENPKASADTSITCMTCHDQGRLAARLNSLNGAK